MPILPVSGFSPIVHIKSGFGGNFSNSARELAAASMSPATRRAYQGALRRLSSWLNDRKLTDESLAEYLACLHESGNSPATCSQVVAAVQFAAKVADRKISSGPSTKRVLAGIRRAGRERGRGQAQGITWEEADHMAEIAVGRRKKLAGIRDAAIIATASDALLRVGELSALRRDDFAVRKDGSGRLAIRFSKTDQEGVGAILYLGASTVARLQAWVDNAAIADGPLFRQVREDGTILKAGLSAHSMRAIIQRCARDAGIEGAVRGHSLRVGAAQSLAGAGAGLVELQTVGRWKSPGMPARYARAEIAGRSAVARLRYGK